MTTVLLVFFGLSSCATLTLVAAVALSARRSLPADSAPLETTVVSTVGGESKRSLLPSYSH